MPRGPLITEAVEILVASVYHKHPKWTATRVQHRVRALLSKYDPDLPAGWPGLNSVQKILAVLRKSNREMKEHPLNKVWSVGVSAQHGISPDAVPFVLKVWESWEERGLAPRTGGLTLRPSVREAQWIGRLCHIMPDDIEALGRVAAIYARVEAFGGLLGHPEFDSTGLDYRLIRSSTPLPFDVRAAVEHVESEMMGSEDIEDDEALGKGQTAFDGGSE